MTTWHLFLADSTIVQVISQLAHASLAMNRYQCRLVQSIIRSLPPNYADVPLVLRLQARAYFESNNYKQSREAFERLRRKHPHYVKDMAYFSSCLWQLQDKFALSQLASDLYDLDQYSPEVVPLLDRFCERSLSVIAWCAP